MIRNYRHKGLEKFAQTGTTIGITPVHARRIAPILDALEAATELQQMNLPGLDLHELKGDRDGEWSASINFRKKRVQGTEKE